MTTIYLVRHGESIANEQGILSGQINPELTDKGRAQIKTTKDRLANVHFDAAYSSDLVRAIETVEIILGKPLPKRYLLETLRERSFGSLDGQPEHHLNMHKTEWQELPDHKSWNYKFVDDMESDNEIAERYIPALEEIAKVNDGNTILIGGHGSVIRTTIRKLNKLSLKDVPLNSFKNGGFVVLTYTDKDGLKVKEIVNTYHEQ